MARSSTTIGTLRLRTEQADTPALRVAVSNCLGAMDMVVHGLPPAAVFIIRSINDPMPGKLSPETGAARPDPQWERRLNAALAEFYRNAERPANGMVRGDTGAVLFKDEAEMNACLLRDLALGREDQCWWWRRIIKRLTSVSSVSKRLSRLLLDTPEIIPPVLWIAAGWGTAQHILSAVEPGDAADLTSAMLHAHGLAQFAGRLASADPNITPVNFGRKDPPLKSPDDEKTDGEPKAGGHPDVVKPMHKTGFGQDNDNRLPPVSSGPGISPWSHIPGFVNASRGNGKAQRTLLGIALTLQQTPWLAGNAQFQRSVLAWRRISDNIQSIHPAEDTRYKDDPGAEPISDSKTREVLDNNKVKTASDEKKHLTPGHGRPSGNQGVPKKRGHRIRHRGSAQTPVTEKFGRQSDEKEMGSPIAFLQPPETRPDTFDAPFTPKMPEPDKGEEEQDTGFVIEEEAVHTHLGGVLYLINLMEILELPDCIVDDRNPTGRPGPWLFLDSLARALVDEQMYDWQDDPLWDMLAQLHGQPMEEPVGGDGPGKRSFRLPVFWLDYLFDERDVYLFSVKSGRLGVYSESGYVIADVIRDSSPPKIQATEELMKFLPENTAGGRKLQPSETFPDFPVHKSCCCLSGMGNDMLFRLNRAALSIRRMLDVALDMNSTTGRAMVEHLFYCPAKIYTTTTHIDLVAPMHNISIHIRKAGLDRDPGWLPGFGRVVRFHFE